MSFYYFINVHEFSSNMSLTRCEYCTVSMTTTDETRLKIMLRKQELVGHVVGGAVIGVAVGMAIQKMLSPRTMQHPPIISATGSFCKCVKNRSRSKNLQTPSHHNKNHCNRHPRSKSACEGPKHSKDEGYLSIPSKSSVKLNLSSSEMDLRSSLENSTNISKSNERYKIIETSKLSSLKTELRSRLENYKNITKNDEKSKIAKKLSNSWKFNLDSSTEYLPIKWNNPKETFVSLLFDINNRKSLVNFSIDKVLDNLNSLEALCDSVEKDAELSFYRDSFGSMSTEYFPIVLEKNVKNSEPTIPIFEENNCNFTSINSLANGDKTINSIIATCATLTKEFDLYCATKNLTDQKFVTLPTFNYNIREPIEHDKE